MSTAPSHSTSNLHPADCPILTAESPDDLLAVIPYLLGYHPDESLVLVLIDHRSLILCARIDLCAGPVADARVRAGEAADGLAGIVRAHQATEAILVGYSTDRRLASIFLDSTIERLTDVTLIEALYTDGHRWWSQWRDRGCSPPEGIAYEPETRRITAEAVYAGMSVASGRDEIVRRVAGPDPGDVDRLQDLTVGIAQQVFACPADRREDWIRSLVDAHVRQRQAGQQPRLDDTERLRLACLAADVTVRDRAWAMMERATAEWHVDLWQQVVDRSVAPFEAAPLCLLGMAAWISGQGTLQVCCAERVRAVDRDYSMGELLAEINTRAMPPQIWDQMQPTIDDAFSSRGEVGISG